jgi:cell filamentation protein
MSYNHTDPYTYPNSTVLKNKLDIKNKSELDIIEAEIYDTKMRINTPKGMFDYNHLMKMHHFLFNDIYDWAGKPREVNIAKKTDYAGTTMFAYSHRIEPELKKILTRLDHDFIVECDRNEFCNKISEYFNEVNAVHPFREGNGRTNRLFFR